MRKLYENLKLLWIQNRILAAATIWGSTVGSLISKKFINSKMTNGPQPNSRFCCSTLFDRLCLVLYNYFVKIKIYLAVSVLNETFLTNTLVIQRRGQIATFIFCVYAVRSGCYVLVRRKKSHSNHSREILTRSDLT